jgi:succinyl-CoA synthetase beta subunit
LNLNQTQNIPFMKIHEYQAKEFFSRYGIPVTKMKLCYTTQESLTAAAELGLPVVVKAQVLVGGRGKAGGVKLARTMEEVKSAADSIIGMDIKGCKVEKVIVTECVDIKKEYYVGMTIDRNTKSVLLMISKEGGVEIEEVAKVNPSAILKFPIDSEAGFAPFMARKISFSLFDNVEHVRQVSSIFHKMYKIFLDTDASLVEINPLVLTDDDQVLALDGKMDFDDNALFRHADIYALNEPTEDEKKEIEAKNKGLAYIRLDGNIGCIVNGAGLAMATLDMIKLHGGEPANFLDIGGSSNPQKVIEAMNLLTSDKNVKSIMINIFGGITRCDDVARGLEEAFKQIKVDLPMVIRLEGTNAKEGLEIIRRLNIPVVETMSDAAIKAVEFANQR